MRPLQFVIVWYADDNFGDNLIRISFQALLEVALSNHGMSRHDYQITPMPLKRINEDAISGADAIFFAGGGLFGKSYLGFFEYVDHITQVAEQRGIPVVFSSMGLNNMSAEAGDVDAIATIVNRRCVKAISVRENLPLFQRLTGDLRYEVRQVADPAVWTKYVYGMTDVTPDRTLGINVVRGGLFAANQRKWGLTAEMDYIEGLLDRAREEGTTAQLYTNGSLDDNNTLRFFARERGVPADQVALPQTTREVVEAIASRSAIASIRMHSSIVAYSFGIPTVALEWNEKVPHFYQAIGRPDRVIPFGAWSADRAFEVLHSAGTAPEYDSDYRDYLMSTYRYIFDAVGENVLAQTTTAPQALDFHGVANSLTRRSGDINEDEFDLRLKLGKTERAYLNRFTTIRRNEVSLRERDSQIASLKRKVNALESQVHDQQRELNLRFTARLSRFARRLKKLVRL